MNAIVYLEYLISPAISNIDKTVNLINELSMLSEHIDLTTPPIIEDDIILKLERDNLYPCCKLFKRNLSQIPNSPFSAEDVRKIVNKIIQRAITFSQIESERIIEWNSKFAEVPIDIQSGERKDEILSLFESTQISNFLKDTTYQNLYYPVIDNSASLKGSISYIYPEDEYIQPPIELDIKSIIYQSYADYLSKLSAYEIYCKSVSRLDFKLAFYIEAINLIKQSETPERELNWKDFDISETLLESARRNESHPDGKFGDLLFQTIPKILADTKSIDVRPFRESEDSGEQKSYADFLAYRTHLSSAGRALRLMFWKSDEVTIFTTVGNKFELEINLPT